MDWDTFFVQQLADLGLKGAVPLVKHVSQNILLGIVNLRSETDNQIGAQASQNAEI